MKSGKTLFQRQPWVALFAITAAAVWGWAYPFIKLGFAEFGITHSMTGSKLLFAGIRFTLSGLIILALAKWQGKECRIRHNSDWWFIVVFALINITFHYAFFYFGLALSAGSRSAILNSLGTFLTVILACIIFRNEHLTWSRIVGCLTGFAGICILNAGSSEGGVSMLGDMMIILNALCGAIASLLTRNLSKRADIFTGTGLSLALGGVLLVIPGLIMGGTLERITPWGCTIMLILIGISTIGFSLYNKLLSCNPVAKVAIYNSLIPVIGAVSSCMCLGEPFLWKYIISGALAALGIYIINRFR